MQLNINNILSIIILAAGGFLVHSCQPDDPTPTPVIQAKISPVSGNTTQTFTFDLTQSQSRTGKGTKVFTRWDWDGDGIWDTPYTRILKYEHRYYSPGTWRPVVEMTNLDGKSDTLSFSVPVIRGYSPPKPVLKIDPPEGHIYTQFVLDAAGSRDDEDSLDLLKFRWDFDGDDIWEVPFSDSMRVTHVYPEIGLYTVQLQVKDPFGLITEKKQEVG
jgi:PKD repeat protein